MCFFAVEIALLYHAFVQKIVAVLEKKVQDMEIQLFQKDQNIYMLQSQLAEATGSGDGSTGNLFGEFSFMAFEKVMHLI